MKAYIQHGSVDNLPMATVSTEVKHAPTWWQLKDLMFTATGYVSKIPTEYMVKLNGRWLRVYCAIYSNIGRLYIVSKGVELTVNIDLEG